MKKQENKKHFESIKHNIKCLGNGTENHSDDIVIARRQDGDIIIKIHSFVKEHLWANIPAEKFLRKINDNKGIYEVIASYPFKIYFDIDGKDKQNNYLDIITKKINEIFHNGDMAISGSETALKKSYHIILNNYLIHDDAQRDKLKRIVSDLKINFDDGFDANVYREKGLMKTINQTKPDDKRIQAIITRDNYEKHIITAFFNEDTKNINDITFTEKQELQQQKKPFKEANNIETDKKPIITNDANIPLINKLLNILDTTRADSGTEFFKLGCLIKSLGLCFDIWFNLSKTSKHYQDGTKNYLSKQWNSIVELRYTIFTLYRWARNDDIEKFNEIMINETITQTEKQRDDLIIINRRYLLDREEGLNDRNNILVSNINKLFSSDKIVSLNLKSPYDTGKTQLIYQLIEKYEPKRILWISYRKTLTYDIYGSFKNLGFQSYIDGDIFSDRPIIQIESLIKLNILNKVAKYDLIIIDEVESILNQFNSSLTFKNREREAFEYFDAVIKNSVLSGGKIISMDGDLTDRTYNFIERYGEQLNINNIVNFNTKKINIINDRNIYNDMLFNALDEDKKIIIPVMSESEAIFYEMEIKKKYPKLEVKKYTGKTGDDDKVKLKNILDEWSVLDVIIYTPTIEAGVSFDLERFDIIFGIIANDVASQRSYFQMLSRVRKIKDNNIYLLNMNGCKLNNCIIETYDEYKGALIEQMNINIKKTYEIINNEMQQIITNDPFDNLYCFNKVEEINKNKYVFLTLFKKIAIQKGYEFEIIEKQQGAKKCTDKPTGELKRSFILNADNISFSKMEELLIKQNSDKIVEDEKYKLCKWMMINELGIDKLDDEIIKIYGGHNYVNKYLSLIDIQNINENIDKNKRIIYERKAQIIMEFLKKLGYDKITSKNKINNSIFNSILLEEVKQNNDIFNNKNKILFSYQNKKLDTVKGILGYINTILKNYSVKIKSIQGREMGNIDKINFYILEPLNGIHDIIKLSKYNNFIDTNNNLLDNDGNLINKKLTTWGHLVKTDEAIQQTINKNINTSYLNLDIFIDDDN
jgi:hypothetical protein